MEASEREERKRYEYALVRRALDKIMNEAPQGVKDNWSFWEELEETPEWEAYNEMGARYAEEGTATKEEIDGAAVTFLHAARKLSNKFAKEKNNV